MRAADLEANLRARDSELTEQRGVADQARTDAEEAVQAVETLRITIDELKAGQALMVDTHAQELAAAQREAQEAAEALRQAEAARKGRGRWARLRAAWRRE